MTVKKEVGGYIKYVWAISAEVVNNTGQSINCEVIRLHAHMVGTNVYHPGTNPMIFNNRPNANMAWETNLQTPQADPQTKVCKRAIFLLSHYNSETIFSASLI